MNKKILAICDTDERYSGKLSELLEERSSFPFSIGVYTDLSVFKRDYTKGIFEVALIADSLLLELPDNDILFNSNICLTVILDSGVMNRGNAPSIWKYQSGENIRKEIMNLCSDYKLKHEKDTTSAGLSPSVSGHRETKVIAVYTPVGRCLQTTFSMTLCHLLSKNNPVLYINLESVCGHSELYAETENGKDITDLIYFLRNNKNKFMYRFESIKNSLIGFDYIPPAKSFVDFKSVPTKDWLELFEVIKDYSHYEFIIVDFSSEVPGLPDLLRYSLEVITLTKPDKVATEKILRYENTLSSLEYDDVIAKTKKIELPSVKIPSSINSITGSEFSQTVNKIILEDLYLGL